MNKRQAVWLILGSSAFLVIIKVGASMLTSSIGILSEALDSFMDVFASLIAVYSISRAAAPPDSNHRYGHTRYEHLAGVIEATLIIFAVFLIVSEALSRLNHPMPIHSIDLGIAVMIVSMMVNLIVARSIIRTARSSESMALTAESFRMRIDFFVSLAVLLSLMVIDQTGILMVDPLMAIAVSIFAIISSANLLKRASTGLLDSSIPPEELTLIRNVLMEHAPLNVNFHKLRTRFSGNVRFVDLHLLVSSRMTVKDAHELADHLEKEIESRLPQTQVMIHLEPEGPDGDIKD